MNAVPKPLPQVLRRGGFTLRLVERRGCAAIYRQERPGCSPAYEVIRIRTRPPTRIHGKTLPEREAYPGNERWGRDAWTYSQCGGRLTPDQVLAQARQKMTEILSRTTDPPGKDAAPVAENNPGPVEKRFDLNIVSTQSNDLQCKRSVLGRRTCSVRNATRPD